MKDFEKHPPLVVKSAKGSILHTDEGPIIDALSSWWCKSLGHGHPEIIEAMTEQLHRFEHVTASNTTHPLLIELSQTLCQLSGKHHVFFTSDGACAVEAALKMTLHGRKIRGEHQRDLFISLKNSYHGETLGALSVSDLGLYKKPYEGFGFNTHFMDAGPEISDMHDPFFQNATSAWEKVLPELERIHKRVTAIIVEPLIQGAGNMRFYSADFLRRLGVWAKEKNIWLIADEIMTGLGRTGRKLASEYAGISPDLICLSKGLTGGTVPLSTVLVDSSIYELFYADYHEGRSFLHSHTYSGNALGASAALATLRIMEREDIPKKAEILGEKMKNAFIEIAEETGKLSKIRMLGGIVAADLTQNAGRIGYELYLEARRRGALLRPIGHTLYWLPPLNIEDEIIENLKNITLHSIHACYKKSKA